MCNLSQGVSYSHAHRRFVPDGSNNDRINKRRQFEGVNYPQENKVHIIPREQGTTTTMLTQWVTNGLVLK